MKEKAHPFRTSQLMMPTEQSGHSVEEQGGQTVNELKQEVKKILIKNLQSFLLQTLSFVRLTALNRIC